MKKIIVLLFLIAAAQKSFGATTMETYNSIDGIEKIVSYEAFEYAYEAYWKAPEECQGNYLTVNDFKKNRYQKRSAVIEMSSLTMIKGTFVSHGRNSDDGKGNATKFSNEEGSNQSSLGIYCTAETYYGSHGLSLRLDGLSEGLNDEARDRLIVIHGANYVSNNGAGRSLGCPAYSHEESTEIINLIKGGSIVAIYSDELNNTL